jgi:hypothetical protein
MSEESLTATVDKSGYGYILRAGWQYPWLGRIAGEESAVDRVVFQAGAELAKDP